MKISQENKCQHLGVHWISHSIPNTELVSFYVCVYVGAGVGACVSVGVLWGCKSAKKTNANPGVVIE